MSTDTQGARFALDESKAAGWIAAAIAASEADEAPGELPEVSESYCAGSGDYAAETAALVDAAIHAGIITDPLHRDQATLAWEFAPSDGMGCAGYRWLLYADVSDEAEGHVIVTTAAEGMWALGQEHGAASAMTVLREAAESGNALADDLERYVASLPLAVRAPEVAELVAQLPAGEWGADELAALGNWLNGHGFEV
jgi:hypothetical protein